MNNEEKDFSDQVAREVAALGIAPTPENKMLYLVYRELRKIGNHLEVLLAKQGK